MDVNTVASIGIGLLKNKESLGSALGALGSLGKLSGEGFSKIAQQFHLPTKISNPIRSALDENNDPSNINGVQLLSQIRFFDADHNGEITQQELNQGLQQLEKSGLAGENVRLHQLGEQLLKNYGQVSQLDGNSASITYGDIGKLMRQDGKLATLSPADWQKLNA